MGRQSTYGEIDFYYSLGIMPTAPRHRLKELLEKWYNYTTMRQGPTQWAHRSRVKWVVSYSAEIAGWEFDAPESFHSSPKSLPRVNFCLGIKTSQHFCASAASESSIYPHMLDARRLKCTGSDGLASPVSTPVTSPTLLQLQSALSSLRCLGSGHAFSPEQCGERNE